MSTCAVRNGRRKMEDKHVVIHNLNAQCNLNVSVLFLISLFVFCKGADSIFNKLQPFVVHTSYGYVISGDNSYKLVNVITFCFHPDTEYSKKV